MAVKGRAELVHLAEDGGPNSAMQLPFLLASEGFEIVGQAAVSRLRCQPR
jgi:hypothetical protein